MVQVSRVDRVDNSCALGWEMACTDRRADPTAGVAVKVQSILEGLARDPALRGRPSGARGEGPTHTRGRE
jgi:hypothetical protein